MLSGTRTRIVEGTQEQSLENENERQRDAHFQGIGSSSLGNDPVMCYEAFNEEFCHPTRAYEIDQETVQLPSGCKGESELWDFETIFRMNSPEYSSSGSDCSQDAMVPSGFGNAFNMDGTNSVPPPAKRELVEGQGHIAVTANSQANSRKRSAEDAFTTDSVKTDAGRATQKAKTDAGKQEKTRTQYACPFQKLDPVKHHECLKYALHRIKDVKQHVYRRHTQPDYYCARCFVVFPTANARDEHARSKDCENKKVPAFEGITDAMKTQLNKSPSRGLDAGEQWFRMWDIIFPEEKRPSSFLVGGYMEEMVPVLRSLWTRYSSSILDISQRDRPRPVDPVELDAMAKMIFDILAEEASTSLAETKGDGYQIQRSLTDGESPILTQPPTAIDESPNPLYSASPYYFQDVNGEPEAEYHIGSRLAWGEG